MKKKIFVCVAGFVIVLGVIGIVLFLILTDTGETVRDNVNLEGDWKVLRRAGIKAEDEYIIFTSDGFTDYCGVEGQVLLEGEYQYVNGTLVLPDYDKEFSVRGKSDNNIILIEEGSGDEWDMIRCSLEGKRAELPIKESIEGDWLVIMHAGTHMENETLSFTENTVTDYRDVDVYLESGYNWETDNIININELKLNLEVYVVNSRYLIMVEENTGYVWELARK